MCRWRSLLTKNKQQVAVKIKVLRVFIFLWIFWQQSWCWFRQKNTNGKDTDCCNTDRLRLLTFRLDKLLLSDTHTHTDRQTDRHTHTHTYSQTNTYASIFIIYVYSWHHDVIDGIHDFSLLPPTHTRTHTHSHTHVHKHSHTHTHTHH